MLRSPSTAVVTITLTLVRAMALAFTEEPDHDFDASKPLDGCGNGNGRSQNAVRKEGSTADHGRDNQPLTMFFYQGVKGEDAAFSVVVCFQGDEDELDGGQQGDSPDDQRQGTDDELFINLADASVSSHDGLHNVKG